LCALGADFAGDAGDGHGRAVDAGHEKTLEHDLVEVGVGSAWSRNLSVSPGLFICFHVL
jgi:hypothetical protein